MMDETWTWDSSDVLVKAKPQIEVPKNDRLDLLKKMSKR